MLLAHGCHRSSCRRQSTAAIAASLLLLLSIVGILTTTVNADLQCKCDGYEKICQRENATNGECLANNETVVSDKLRGHISKRKWTPSCVLLERIIKANGHQVKESVKRFTTCYYCPRPRELAGDQSSSSSSSSSSEEDDKQTQSSCTVIERQHDVLRVACCWSDGCNGRTFEDLCPHPKIFTDRPPATSTMSANNQLKIENDILQKPPEIDNNTDHDD